MNAQSLQKKRTPRKAGRPSASGPTADMESQLMTAALTVFGDKGYDGASLSQIAEHADADIALIRYYFGSKQDLWHKALSQLSEELGREGLRTLADAADQSATQQLVAAISWFLTMSAEKPFVSRIIVSEGNDTGPRGHFIAKEFVGPFYKIMATLIDGAKQEGTVPNVSTRTIFFMITHGGSFPMAMPTLTNAFPGGKIESKKALAAHVDAITSLIVRA